MHADAITALKKFAGGSYAVGRSDGPAIKCEPDQAFAAWHRGGYRGTIQRGRGMSRGRFNSRGNGANFQRVNSNPIGKDGRQLLCYKCNSHTHLAWACPNKTVSNVNAADVIQTSDKSEEVDKVDKAVHEAYVILYTGYDKNKVNNLCHETVGCAILDSACASNVAGSLWMEDFIENRIDAFAIIHGELT